jgi:glutaryl-CoA dehydrogenase
MMTVTVTAPRIDAVFDLDALLDDEEREWQQRARRFAQERILPVIEDDFEQKHFRREFVRELGELGFLGMHLTGYGCAGAGAVSYGLVCLELEAADSGWRTFVSVQGSLAMSAIHKYGSEEQKQRWLPGMAAGELIGCFALTEPQGGSDPRRDDDGRAPRRRRLGARRREALDRPRVACRRGRGLGPGRRPVGGLRAGRQCRARLPRAHVGSGLHRHADRRQALDARVGAVRRDPRGRAARRRRDAAGASGLSGPFGCLNEARYGIVWGAMGAARSCLEAALERSVTREVFGKPIGANQLIQAKLADMFVEVEKGILLALHLGRLKERGALTPAQVSVGKLNSVREALQVAHEARAILAGDGITDAWPVMRHAANLESVRTYEGTDEIHQLVLGRALTGLNAF